MSSYYTYEGNLRDRNKFTSTVNTSFGVKRYFSSLDTEVYFGAQQVDEIVAIDFAISEPKLPIYGFNSFYANRIISGRRTIQGTFAINFTSTNYLLNILNSIDDSVLKASFMPTGTSVALDYESLVYRCEGEDTTGLGIGNNAVFSKIFDITLSYGYGKSENKTYNSCYQTLVGVQIVDYRQALDTEGNPILDMYSFIAKDIRYIDAETKEDTEEEQPAPTPGDEQDPPIDAVEYEIGNEQITSEVEKVTSACQNSTTPGYLVNPTFNYTPPGNYAADAYPYLRLTINSQNLNDTTKEFTDVIITIDSLAIQLNNVVNGDAHGEIFEFKGDYRDLGVELSKFFKERGESGSIDCTVEFYSDIDNKATKRIHNTILNLGSIGPTN